MSAVQQAVPKPSALGADVRLGSGLRDQRLLARNTLINLFGQCAPMLVAAFVIPRLTRGLGADRFGVLTLGWVILGYFSLFDLGLGRALTKLVAERLGGADEEDVPSLIWTSLLLMLALGVAGGIVSAAMSEHLVTRTLKVPRGLTAETLQSFYLLAISIPVVIVTSGLRGILEAAQRFDLLTMVRVPMGVFSYLGPALTLPFSHSLVPIVGVLLIGRTIAAAVHMQLVLQVFPRMTLRPQFSRTYLAPLLSFGSWMTITNIVGPLMVVLDRFLIGSRASTAAVAFYTAPYEAVTKLWLIPAALTGVLFPAFAASVRTGDRRTVSLYVRALKAIFVLLFPATLLIVCFAREGLLLWLGPLYASNSASVLRWLALGVLLNGLAQVPYWLLQGRGRPDLTAKLHLIELPLYIAAAWYMIGHHGIEGAAIAWAVRCGIDALVLFAMVARIREFRRLHLRLALVGAGILVTLATAAVDLPLPLKVGIGALVAVVYLPSVWWLVLDRGERAELSRLRSSRA